MTPCNSPLPDLILRNLLIGFVLFAGAYSSGAKLVLTVDYATASEHIDDAYAKSSQRGYVPYVTVRALDQLTVNPGHAPE